MPRLAVINDAPVTFTEEGGTLLSSQVQCYFDAVFNRTAAFYKDGSHGRYCHNMLFCGDIDNDAGIIASTRFTHYLDLYANAAGERRINPSSTNFVATCYYAASWIAPQGSSAVTGQWSQSAGSKFLVRTGSPHALCAGTLVHGTGIPEGAFLRRIFADDRIELSAAVTETVTANDVTFDAFSPKVYQSMRLLGRNNNDPGGYFAIMKHRAEDEFVFEVGELQTSAMESPNMCFKTDAGYFPGRIVIHDGSGAYGRLTLGTVDMMLATGANGGVDNCGFPNARVQQETSSDVTKLTVTNGLAATIGEVAKLLGRIEKHGSGTLRTALAATRDNQTGALSVKEGVLELTAVETPWFKAVEIASGATLKLPAGLEIEIDTFDCQPGAILSGGRIRVAGMAQALEMQANGLVLTDGASLVFDGSSQDEALDAPAVTNVVGVPALWFDVSRADRLTTRTVTVDGASAERIDRIDDVRGAEHAYAENASSVHGPRLVRDADGNPHHYVAECRGGSGMDSAAQQHVLLWNRQVANIRSVFKVICHDATGHQYLGRSSSPWSGWLRLEGQSWYDSVFYSESAAGCDAVKNGEFRLNGIVSDWSKGYAYFGAGRPSQLERDYTPQVTEFHLGKGESPWADNSGEYTFGGGNNPRAGQRLYEIIVYTNELTAAEKRQVRGYLMQKWLKAEADYAFEDPANKTSALNLDSKNKILDVAAGGAVVGVTSGSGSLTKYGNGTLMVEEFALPDADLVIEGGTLRLRSVQADSLGFVPDGAVVHVDASDTSTLTTDGSGSVSSIADVRGAGYPILTRIGTSTAQSRIESNALNNRAMIRMRGTESGSTADSPGFLLPSSIDVRTVATVLRTQDSGDDTYLNGGVLLGSYATKDPQTNGRLYGIYRYGGGVYPGSIILPAAYWWWYGDSNGAMTVWRESASMALLNGQDANLQQSSYRLMGLGDRAIFSTKEPIYSDALWHVWNKDYTATYYAGGCYMGETLVYRTALSATSMKRLDAYFAKKWFASDTPGYRPAKARHVTVAAGATLELSGTAPLAAETLTGGGTVSGAVTLADDAGLKVAVADGAVQTLTVTGGLSGRGTVHVIGDIASLEVGDHVLVTAASIPGTWTLALDGAVKASRTYALVANGTSLTLHVGKKGMSVIIR